MSALHDLESMRVGILFRGVSDVPLCTSFDTSYDVLYVRSSCVFVRVRVNMHIKKCLSFLSFFC